MITLTFLIVWLSGMERDLTGALTNMFRVESRVLMKNTKVE